MYTYQKTCLPQNDKWHQHQGSCLPEVPRYPLHFQINRKGLSNSNSSTIHHNLKQAQRCMEKSTCSKVSLNHTCLGYVCLHTVIAVRVHGMDVLAKMAVLEVHTLTRVHVPTNEATVGLTAWPCTHAMACTCCTMELHRVRHSASLCLALNNPNR